MPMKNNPVRYAHTDGHTDVCYSEEGKYIITCGNDGDIRVWLGLEDDDPTSHCVGENALALAQMGSKLYIGTDDNTLRCYKFPQMERDGVLTRFSKPVTHISLSPDGSTLAAASENSEIYVRDLTNQKFKTLTGHSGPILSVAVDPKLEYLASSSGDGKVCVWDLGSATSVQSWQCASVCESFFEARVLCRPSWEPDGGRYLAVPQGSSVAVYLRESWQGYHVFSHPDIEKEVSICSFSPCGNYLAASSVAGDVAVWHVGRKSCTGVTKQDKKLRICALAWNPSGSGEMAFCDFSGQLGTVVGCLQEQPQEPQDDGKVEEPRSLAGLDSDDDDDENTISLEKIKSLVAVGTSDDPGDSASAAGGPEEDDDDDGARVRLSELQPPFQPSATPPHLQHRFMVWNSVGTVRCSSLPEEVIDVEFHDSSTHHALHIRNLQSYTMASLCERALVLASECDADSPSKVRCVLLDCWDGSKEWSVELPAGEGALCVGCGPGWVAVATDTRLLRLWTLTGAQREVVALPGPVLCLAQHDTSLLLACHLAPGLDGDQSVGVAQLCTSTGRLSRWQPLPLAPRASLQWLGFSDEGSPCLHDTSGSVRLLTGRGYWLPVLHTASLVKGKSDHYFVLGLSELSQCVRAVLCKGSRYPPTTPRPPVLEIPLKVGLADVTTDRGQLEEQFWRSTLAAPRTPASQDSLKAAKEASIKLFAMSCRADQLARAAELCSLMADEQVVQLALKYASKLGKTQLADRISRLDLSHLSSSSHQPHSRESGTEELYLPGRKPANMNGYSGAGDLAPADDVNQVHAAVSSRRPPGRGGVLPTEPGGGGGSLLVDARACPGEAREPSVPILGASQTRTANPFKKSAGTLQLGRGLSNLGSLPRVQPSLLGGQARGGDTSRQARLSLHSKDTKRAGAQTFVDWYSGEEAALKEKFPDLSSQELTKEGLKLYRQLQRKQASGANTTDEGGVEAGIGPPAKQRVEAVTEEQGDKRKQEDEETGVEAEGEDRPPAKKPARASSKLTAFLFKKSS